jgi:phosphoadenosine phosphosulfate reductase
MPYEEAIQTIEAARLDNACLTCSFQLEDLVVLELVRARRPDVPVIFLDTGYHFPAVLELRDRLAAEWKLNLINTRPVEHAIRGLYRTDPAACCQQRKVEPLGRALAPYDVWFTGLRREQSPTRANLQLVEPHRLPGGRVIQKLSPLAAWTWRDVAAYAEIHSLPLLPLYAEGYPSIGCEPCTAKPAPGADPRSGRWGGVKLECGIHTFTAKQ